MKKLLSICLILSLISCSNDSITPRADLGIPVQVFLAPVVVCPVVRPSFHLQVSNQHILMDMVLMMHYKLFSIRAIRELACVIQQRETNGP